MCILRTRRRVIPSVIIFLTLFVISASAHAQVSVLGSVGSLSVGEGSPAALTYDPTLQDYFGLFGQALAPVPCVPNGASCASPATPSAWRTSPGNAASILLLDGFASMAVRTALGHGVVSSTVAYSPDVTDVHGVGGMLIIWQTSAELVACRVSSVTIARVLTLQSTTPPCNDRAAVIGLVSTDRPHRIAYLASARQWLVLVPDEAAHRLVFRRLSPSGDLIGDPGTIDTACADFDVTANPALNQWAVAAWSCRQEPDALRLISVAADGAIVGDRVLATTTTSALQPSCCQSGRYAQYTDPNHDGSVAIGFSPTTGNYIVVYGAASPGVEIAEVAPGGSVLSRERLDTFATDRGMFTLSYNAVSRTFLLLGAYKDSVGQGQAKGFELNRHGAVLGAGPAWPLANPSEIIGFGAAPRSDQPQWFALAVSRVTFYVGLVAFEGRAALLGGSTSAQGSDARLGGCSTSDPFTAIGGGACIGGGWSPAASVPAAPPFVQQWATLDVTASFTSQAGARGVLTIVVTNRGPDLARHLIVEGTYSPPMPSGSAPPGWVFVTTTSSGSRWMFTGDLAPGASAVLRLEGSGSVNARATNADLVIVVPPATPPVVAGVSGSPTLTVGPVVTWSPAAHYVWPAITWNPDLDSYVVAFSHGTDEAVGLVAPTGVVGPITQLSAYFNDYQLPTIAASPDLGGATRVGGVLVAWGEYCGRLCGGIPGRVVTQTAAGPNLDVGVAHVIDGDATGKIAPTLAYSRTSHCFLIVWQSSGLLVARRLGPDGTPLGSTIALGTGVDGKVSWNPATDEFGIAAVERDPAVASQGLATFTRIQAASGTVVGRNVLGASLFNADLAYGRGVAVAVNDRTGQYLVTWSGLRLTVTLLASDGQILARGTVASFVGHHWLAYYAASDRFLLLVGTHAFEFGADGQLLGQPIALEITPTGSPATRPDQPGWLVAGFDSAGATRQLFLAPSAPTLIAIRLGGCTGADPFSGSGGGACIDGRWLRRSDPVPLTVRAPSTARHLVDFDGDGLGDVFTYRASGAWTRRLAQPNGGFVNSDGAWMPGWTVQPARFDDDARTDLFLINEQTGRWFKMLSDSSGFTAQATGTWSTGWQRFIVDLDGDDVSDVFLWNPSNGLWFKCLSTSTGFTYEPGAWSPGWEVYPMTLNVDRLEDFFLFNRATGQWFWALTSIVGGFEYSAAGYWSTDWTLHPGDFIGNGVSDLLLWRARTGEWVVARPGNRQFTYTSGAWTPGWAPTVADFDGDGYEDVFLHRSDTGQWFELVSTGTGTFHNVVGGFWTRGWQLWPTKLDTDGRADLLLYDPSNGRRFTARQTTLDAFTYEGDTWEAGLAVVAGLYAR